MSIKGLWVETILYEIPLLALTSEAYFKFCEKDWDHEGQVESAYRKGCTMLQNGCVLSEFGSRRRRDYKTHDMVMEGLVRARDEGQKAGWAGTLTGTSNVHFAKKYGVAHVGTVAHEWYMGIAAVTDDYEHANETALRYWLSCFGEGVSLINLVYTVSDTMTGAWNCIDRYVWDTRLLQCVQEANPTAVQCSDRQCCGTIYHLQYHYPECTKPVQHKTSHISRRRQ